MGHGEPVTEEREKEYFQALKRCDTQTIRHELIELYIPLVKQIALKIHMRRIGNDVDFNDCVNYGVLGLIESIDTYNVNSPARFATYAHYRIRGAILNGLNKTSESRAHIAYLRRLRRERLNVENPGGSKRQGFRELMDIVVRMAIGYSLEINGDDATTLQGTPYNRSEFELLCERSRGAVRKLKPNEQEVIQCHYYEFMTFEEIATKLSLTKGRVSQLHRSALSSIRDMLEKKGMDARF